MSLNKFTSTQIGKEIGLQIGCDILEASSNILVDGKNISTEQYSNNNSYFSINFGGNFNDSNPRYLTVYASSNIGTQNNISVRNIYPVYTNCKIIGYTLIVQRSNITSTLGLYKVDGSNIIPDGLVNTFTNPSGGQYTHGSLDLDLNSGDLIVVRNDTGQNIRNTQLQLFMSFSAEKGLPNPSSLFNITEETPPDS